MEWISVSEEMPEKDLNVLVFHGGDVIMIAWWDGNDWCENSEEIHAPEHECLSRTITEEEHYKLTHWMPLPPPPTL